MFILSRGLVLRRCWSYSNDGRVCGGPVLGLGCDGLQRLCEWFFSERYGPIIVRPMCCRLLRKSCERSNELYGLSFWQLLRHGRADISYGDMLSGVLCDSWGHLLHFLLGRLVPERLDYAILRAMRLGSVY